MVQVGRRISVIGLDFSSSGRLEVDFHIMCRDHKAIPVWRWGCHSPGLECDPKGALSVLLPGR